MRVIHEKTQADSSLATAKVKAWLYRTRVENDGDRPVRVIWFEFYYFDDHHDTWNGTNVRNRPLRTAARGGNGKGRSDIQRRFTVPPPWARNGNASSDDEHHQWWCSRR